MDTIEATTPLVKKTSTDQKSIEYKFDGSSDELLQNFFKKIRAKIGVVKYHMKSWSSFPTDLENAKSLGKDWAIQFTKNSKYNGFIINIYFHIQHKTIRFQVKKYVQVQNNSFNIQDVNDLTNEIPVNTFMEKLEPIPSINTFIFDNVDSFPELEYCKEMGKNLSKLIEQTDKFKGFKAIVFLNPSKKSVKITLTNDF